MKVFYSAFTCIGNVGDFIINKYQIEEYSKYCDVFVDFTGMPDAFRDGIIDDNNPRVHDFVKTYGVSYRGRHMFRVLSLLRSEGFTHFTKSPGPYAVISFPFPLFLKRLLGAVGYWCARRNGMKVFAMGIDLNLASLPCWLRKLNVKYFNCYHLLGVRSISNKDKMIPYIPFVEYCPDMAFLCSNLEKPTKNIRKKIAISFRSVDNINVLLESLRYICFYFSKRGYKIDIIYQVQEDYGFCKKLNDMLMEFHPSFREEMISFKTINSYVCYDYVFSNRLHVLLMAIMHGGIPFAIVSNDIREQKIMNIWESVFDGGFCMHMNDSLTKIEVFLDEDLVEMRESVYKAASFQKTLCEGRIRQLFE